jgi:putative transposase
MPEYRRWRVAGGTYFFTVVTDRRRPIFADDGAVQILWKSIREERKLRPFSVDAVVVLPDHCHLMMTLPDGDDNYSTRMNQIKRRFTIAFGGARSERPGRSHKRMADVWQPRFWEHLVRDNDEREALAGYMHYNPVRHGYVGCPHQWKWSSFRYWVRYRWLERDWSCSCRGNAKVPYPESLVDLCGELDEM